MPEDERSATDRLLDVLVYGPLGFVLEADELVPRLAQKGRATLEGQVGTARVLGQMVVAQGRRELERQIERLRAGTPFAERSPAGPGGGPGPGAAPDPDAAPEPEAAPPAEGVADPQPSPPAAKPRHDADEAAALAIPDYDSLAASQVVPRLAGLTGDELEAVRRYEAAHRGRRTILTRVGQLQAGR